jgi:hypothetical protein
VLPIGGAVGVHPSPLQAIDPETPNPALLLFVVDGPDLRAL